MTVELVSRPAIGPMVDPFGRHVRVSVTDRCDFRCVYCMSEHMTFLPKKDLLTLEELDRLCSAFVAKGVRKLRITGGEPLVRKNILWLFRALSRHLGTLGLLVTPDFADYQLVGVAIGRYGRRYGAVDARAHFRDALIAVCAARRGAVVVTDNVRDLARWCRWLGLRPAPRVVATDGA